MNTIVYNAFSNIYINLTNKCSNNCEFCIRSGKSGVYGVDNLWLDSEPSALDVTRELEKNPSFNDCKEVVFCGFGEPTYKIDEIVEIGAFLHSQGKKSRINTNGHGNLIHNYDISEKLAKSVDVINISLNASDSKKYQQICHSQFGEKSFDSLIDLAVSCKRAGGNVIFSVVDSIGRDEIVACKKLCEKIGIPLRIRAFEE